MSLLQQRLECVRTILELEEDIILLRCVHRRPRFSPAHLRRRSRRRRSAEGVVKSRLPVNTPLGPLMVNTT